MFPTEEQLAKLSTAAIQEHIDLARDQHQTMLASIDRDNLETLEADVVALEEVQAFIASAQNIVDSRAATDNRLTAASVLPASTADSGDTPADSTDVADTVTTTDVANTETKVVTAAVANRRAPSVSDVAALAPEPDVNAGVDQPYTIVAAAPLATSSTDHIPAGQTMSWKQLGKAFVEATRGHQGMKISGVSARQQNTLAVIRRDFGPEGSINVGDDSHQAFAKLQKASDDYARNGLTAANGWCAPSEPDYSICSPITGDGLLNLPERVLRRGGLIHNQGLDFGDFFGDDFTLPIPGYNILTEAEVIADTPKTCVEIPCPSFIDDRLNVAALCLTGSLLQNSGYPEFVSTFVEGAVMSMAHLVNREVINGLVAGSVAVNLTTVDPWGTDGTVWSQIMSLIDFAATDLRYVYRAARNQMVEIVLPDWLRTGLRADYIRRNATATDDLADEVINAALARRRVQVQWVYDWQDAFNATVGADANHSMGQALVANLYNIPTTVQMLAYLPGTWVLGRQDVIRLDTVYDSTNLAQNLVTQLFMEDGYLPMRMCAHSRAYTVPICANGSTGVQRAVTCSDVTP